MPLCPKWTLGEGSSNVGHRETKKNGMIEKQNSKTEPSREFTLVHH